MGSLLAFARDHFLSFNYIFHDPCIINESGSKWLRGEQKEEEGDRCEESETEQNS